MDGTVVVENNTKVQELFDKILGVETKRRHISIRNKYAVGIVRKYRELFIYDYERSSRPLAKIKNGGTTTLLRLGFGIFDVTDILEELLRILQAVVAPKPDTPAGVIPEIPTYPSKDISSSIGINKDGKITMQIKNTSEFKTRVHKGVVS